MTVGSCTFSVTVVSQTVALTKLYSYLSPDSTCESNTVHHFLSSPSKCPRGLRPRLYWNQKRHNTTQQSGQTPDKEVQIKQIIVYVVSCYSETDPTGMVSPPTVWRQQSEFVSSRQSGQIPAAVCIVFECCCNGQNVCNRTC